ncbi:MAG: flagellar biosynthetic protein FliR [Armatimonadetes bacterium]|nr:flagellar biosynthetic protein FliR [Armatimonadota bacterium]
MQALADQLLLFLAGTPRLLGLVALAPGLSNAIMPPQVRVALAVGLAVALGPLVASPDPALSRLPLGAYLLLLLGELAVGVALGFCLSCLLEAARLAGELADFQIGFNAGELYDPVAGGTNSILGRLWYLAAVLFFFQLDGHHWLIGGLARSYVVCPVGEVVLQRHWGLLAGQVLQSSFALGLRLAAPLVAALIMADFTLGLVSRGMPQMNVLFVGMPAKIAVGLAALAACSPGLGSALGDIVGLARQVMLRAVGGP